MKIIRILESIRYWNDQKNESKVNEIISMLKGAAKKEALEYYQKIKR